MPSPKPSTRTVWAKRTATSQRRMQNNPIPMKLHLGRTRRRWPRKSLAGLSSEVDKTDGEEERHSEKSRSEYTPIRRSSRCKEENPQNKPRSTNFPRQGRGAMTISNASRLRMPSRERSRIRERIRTFAPCRRSPDICRSLRRKISHGSTRRTGNSGRHRGGRKERVREQERKEKQEKNEDGGAGNDDFNKKMGGPGSRKERENAQEQEKIRIPRDKLRQEKEAEKHKRQKELQQESNRLGIYGWK